LGEGANGNGGSPLHGTPEKGFDQLIGELRPRLHRYCARMTGSVIDGEDVVQEAIVKALDALPRTEPLTNPEGWLFRIAHNAAQDFLRRRARRQATHSDEDVDMIAARTNPMSDHQVVTASLRTFMRLPVAQRSAVILRDVLGYSVDEVCTIMDGSIPATKAALQRGRARLRQLASEGDDAPLPVLAEPERVRLMSYVERFNARDFDSVRNMLAEDVRLDLVNRLRMKGRSEVGQYFHRYSLSTDWQCVAGFVEGRPAILMCDPNDPAGRPAYFILLDWDDDNVVAIRDFRFARYAIDEAELLMLG
jgi:RNA polymerase sigma-70 factor (ECF subfamily)